MPIIGASIPFFLVHVKIHHTMPLSIWPFPNQFAVIILGLNTSDPDITTNLTSRAILSKWTRLASAALLIFYAALLLSQTLSYFYGGSLSAPIVWLAVSSAVGFYFVVGRKSLHIRWLHLLIGFAFILVWVLLAGLASALVFDLSADGRDYHQTAIMRLVAGWNPVTQAQGQDNTYLSMWLNHYPRGPWIAAASLYQFTGEIETGKLFTLLLMAAVFLICWSFLLELPRLSMLETVVLAVLAAANPVSITQSLSYTIDGQVAAAYTLILVWMLAAGLRIDLTILMGLAAASLIALNIKFTSTVYTVLLLGILLPIGLWLRKSWSWVLKVGAAVSLGVLLGVLVVGYRPYIVNQLNFGNPFYPLYGGEQFNHEFVMRGQTPLNFKDKAWGEKMIISLFSPSQNTYQADSGPLKLPFTLSIEEIKQFRMSDVRLAGMGPLFSGALLLSIAALAALLMTDRKVGLTVAGLSCIIFLTMLVNPEAWWARYAPQFWLLPVIIAAGCLASKANRLLRWSGWILIVVLIANVILISGAYLAGNLRDTWLMHKQLQMLAQSQQPVLVYYGTLESTALKLDSAGLNYRVVESIDRLPCPELLAPMVYISPADCAVPDF